MIKKGVMSLVLTLVLLSMLSNVSADSGRIVESTGGSFFSDIFQAISQQQAPAQNVKIAEYGKFEWFNSKGLCLTDNIGVIADGTTNFTSDKKKACCAYVGEEVSVAFCVDKSCTARIASKCTECDLGCKEGYTCSKGKCIALAQTNIAQTTTPPNVAQPLTPTQTNNVQQVFGNAASFEWYNSKGLCTIDTKGKVEDGSTTLTSDQRKKCCTFIGEEVKVSFCVDNRCTARIESKCTECDLGCKEGYTCSEGKCVAPAQTNVNPSDVTPPVITKNFIISEKKHLFSKPYPLVMLGITTDEPSQCKISKHNNPFDAMSDYFGDSYFVNDHNVTLNLTSDYDYIFYVKCKDSFGNKNFNDYIINLSATLPNVEQPVTPIPVTITQSDIAQPSSNTQCSNECPIKDSMQCFGTGIRVCRQIDSDPCLEWSSVVSCGSGRTCINDQCVTKPTTTTTQPISIPTSIDQPTTTPQPNTDQSVNSINPSSTLTLSSTVEQPTPPITPTNNIPSTTTTQTNNVPPTSNPQCSNECTLKGAKQCFKEGIRTCGNYDSDSCLEWSGVFSCGPGKACVTNQCITKGITPANRLPAAFCRDSDNGQNYYVKGEISNRNGVRASDTCNSFAGVCPSAGGCKGGDYLIEWYCKPGGYYTPTFFKCPKGCKDGRCIA